MDFTVDVLAYLFVGAILFILGIAAALMGADIIRENLKRFEGLYSAAYILFGICFILYGIISSIKLISLIF